MTKKTSQIFQKNAQIKNCQKSDEVVTQRLRQRLGAQKRTNYRIFTIPLKHENKHKGLFQPI